MKIREGLRAAHAAHRKVHFSVLGFRLDRLYKTMQIAGVADGVQPPVVIEKVGVVAADALAACVQ
ncbi:hypothetical protein SDC9_196962 [bioreactor metagenome]|uniref:Uncharacterized protein n=1 Tax=bioreactor metagenome TaxID=1076179 RepID=A0A645IM02_9ZZZZ